MEKITVVGTTGSTTITAKVEGTEYEATCKVSIIQKVTSITAKNVTVGKNQTAKIEVTTIPTGLVEDLTYVSDTPNIATVAEDGTVTGVATGSATIIIKGKISTNVSTTCTVTVTKNKNKCNSRTNSSKSRKILWTSSTKLYSRRKNI